MTEEQIYRKEKVCCSCKHFSSFMGSAGYCKAQDNKIEDMIDIISECMITEWLKPKIYSDELLESRLNTKDFTEFSPAKLIEHTRYVYEMSENNSRAMVNNYTFSHDDVAELNKP